MSETAKADELVDRIEKQIRTSEFAGSYYDNQVVALLKPAKEEIISLRAQLAAAEESAMLAKGQLTALELLSIRALEAAETKLASARKAVRDLLIYEQLRAKNIGWSDCTCMGQSREHESAYEAGQCPHQVAHEVLSDTPGEKP